MSKAIEILEKNKIKPSFIRIKILEYLMNTKTHPTAHEIYEQLKKEIPTLSKTSVYLNLNLFLKKKIIMDLKTKEEQRFDFIQYEHINFYCRICKKVFDLPIVNYIKENDIKVDEFMVEKINIYLEGVCKDCGKP